MFKAIESLSPLEQSPRAIWKQAENQIAGSLSGGFFGGALVGFSCLQQMPAPARIPVFVAGLGALFISSTVTARALSRLEPR